jgi:hypothetical protein
MKKRLAPFISGVGVGLCLAVVFVTLWGLIWPNKDNAQASLFNRGHEAALDVNQLPDQNNPADEQGSQAVSNLPQGAVQTSEPALSTPIKDGYRVIEIRAGMSAGQISEMLAQEGVIDDAKKFHELSVTLKKTQKFIAGKFTVRYGAPYEELINVLTSPPNAQ